MSLCVRRLFIVVIAECGNRCVRGDGLLLESVLLTSVPMSHPLGSNGLSPLTLKLRSKNTNNRNYFHNIFHYLKEIPHIRFKHKIDERYLHDLE